MERREEEKMEEEDESQTAAERSDGDEEEDKGVDGLDDDGDEEEDKCEDGLDDDDDDGDEEEDKGEDGLDDDDDGDEEEDKGEDGLDDDDDDGDEDEEAPGDETARLQSEAADQRKGIAPSDRKCIPGIVYLGHIPPRLRPRDMRNMLSHYGEIGRIFLQPEKRFVKKKKKKVNTKRCNFSEGWVEFRDKRIAKRVAATLHNTPMSGRKHSRFHADLWCMKYLHRFHWTHLHERLAYERTVLKQRLRTEISQAKRETNFYLSNVEKSQSMDHHRKKREKRGEKVEERQWEFTQRQTEEEIQLKKRTQKNSISQKHLAKAQDKARLIQEKSQSNVSLLAKIFNASKSQD